MEEQHTEGGQSRSKNLAVNDSRWSIVAAIVFAGGASLLLWALVLAPLILPDI